MFEEYKIYGPYWHKNEGRRLVFLVNNKHRTTMSYARYLMSLHLGRYLERDEEIDHIDNDKTNDCIENLQILSPSENKRKNPPGRLCCRLICPNCNKEFLREKRLVYNQVRKNPPCCSHSCSGQFQHKATGGSQKVKAPSLYLGDVLVRPQPPGQ